MSFKKYLTLGVVGSSLIAMSGFAMAEHHEGKDHKGGGKMMEKMFDKGDANGDGIITKAEFLANAEERFNKMDGDGNGEVTKEEAKAHHDAMRTKWKKMKAEKARQEAIEAMKEAPAAEE
ncbi:MAG: hypothetical protein ACRBDI_10315 [Alphaproteobacteria bacterium]